MNSSECAPIAAPIPQLLTVEQVAYTLGVSPAWVYQHSCGARRPSLPSVKLGRAVRFRPEAVAKFIQGMERCT
jgi:excisionase family DNA binding protein